MPKSAQPIVFVVPGQAASIAEGVPGAARGAAATPLPVDLPRGTLKQSVRVGTSRAAGAEVRVTAVPGEDVVVLRIAGGPALMLHPETARDLMLAQQGEIKRSRGAVKGELEPHEVRVPAQLQWRGLEQGAATRGAARGYLGDVLLSAIDVISGVVQDPAADFVASAVVRRVDGQVEAGVYALTPRVAR